MIKLHAYLPLWLPVCFGLLLDQGRIAQASALAVPEEQLKAAYLVHLSEFTTWPDQKMQLLPDFNICIAAGSQLSLPLDDIKGRPVKKKPLKIIVNVTVDNLDTCHVLYVEDKLNKKTFQQSLLKTGSILTVSSDEGFAKEGGVIEYYRDDNKVRMRVNLKAMAQSQLIISSKLLRLMESTF